MMKRRVAFALLVACQMINIVAALQCFVSICKGSPRQEPLLRSWDQLLNVVLGGDEDMMPSAKAWALQDKKWWGRLQRFLDRIDPGHCERAWRAETKKRDKTEPSTEEHY